MTPDEEEYMMGVLFVGMNETHEEALVRVKKELFGDRHFDAKAEKTIDHLIQMALI